jgi:hypothetical protein
MDPTNPIVADYEKQRRDLEQLKASKADMADAIGRQIDWLLEMEAAGVLREPENAKEPFGIAEASARAREPRTYDPGRDPHTGRFSPSAVSWQELGNLLEYEPEKGWAVWQAIKETARQELASGIRGAQAMEAPVHSRPYERAQYLAIVDALREDLQPRGALEALLVQRMAATHSLCLKWQALAIQRQELEEWQGEATKRQEQAHMSPAKRERYRLQYGYLPPRLSQAEAIQEATLMAERYERAFLRLVREFRNQRRMFAALVVAEGGTVNVAEGPQQVNINARSLSFSGQSHKETAS